MGLGGALREVSEYGWALRIQIGLYSSCQEYVSLRHSVRNEFAVPGPYDLIAGRLPMIQSKVLMYRTPVS
jgi:hypothetical protein